MYQHFVGVRRGLKGVVSIRSLLPPTPTPFASCGYGFIVASALLIPAFHLAGEAVVSWNLQTQPDDRSLKVRRDSPTGSQIKFTLFSEISLEKRQDPRREVAGRGGCWARLGWGRVCTSP